MQKMIGYFRVSTEKQGRSGLGLDGQRLALQSYARANDGSLVKCYTEVESGKRSDRPELAKALSHARRAKAQLVVAKLDRLARNVAFTAKLMEAGCEFVCCDMPHANRLTIHILAAVAEAEAKAISDRTKAALAALRARGGRIGAMPGKCTLTHASRLKGAQAGGAATSKAAQEAYADLEFIVAWRKAGMTQWEIAHRLSEEGYTTRRGGEWGQVQVARVLRRFGAK